MSWAYDVPDVCFNMACVGECEYPRRPSPSRPKNKIKITNKEAWIGFVEISFCYGPASYFTILTIFKYKHKNKSYNNIIITIINIQLRSLHEVAEFLFLTCFL